MINNSDQQGDFGVFKWRLLLFDILFISAYFVCMSRGFFEIYIGKTSAYVVQIATWSIFLALLPMVLKVHWMKVNKSIFAYIILGFIVFLSSVLTIFMTGFEYGYIYASVTMYIAALLLYGSSIRPKYIKSSNLVDPIMIVTIVMVTVAFLQQLDIIDMPGDSITEILRPSSITGSYLHYPIVIAILSIIFIQSAILLKKKRYMFMSILCPISVYISFSRSSMMIIGLSIVFWFIMYLNTLPYKKKILVLQIGILLSFIFFGIVIMQKNNFFLSRFIGAFDIKSEGNDSRTEIWLNGINLLRFDTLFYGHYTGLYTNVTQNLTGVSTFVLESGFLQQIVSFGLIGTLAFYAILFGVFLSIEKSCIWLKAVVLASIMQSFVYQSTEVFPFIVLISLLPIISSVINYDLNNRSKQVKIHISL